MLSAKIRENSINVLQAPDDADCLIVNTAISYAEKDQPVFIVGEDVDLIVLMIALTPAEKNVHFLKPGKGKKKNSFYSSMKEQDGTLQLKNFFYFCTLQADVTVPLASTIRGKKQP